MVTLLTLALALTAPARPAQAVPVPWKNCGKSGDIVSVQQLDASMWPPVGTAAPLAGTATFDAKGKLLELQVELLLGPDWMFKSAGGLNATLASGFVTLPASIPLTLVSPPLPIPAGPYNATKTFLSPLPGAQPITITTAANVQQEITSLIVTLSLTHAGMSGFPVPPAAGTYSATLQMTLPSGQGVLCFTIELTDTPFILGAVRDIPTLPEWAQLGLAALLIMGGLLALRRRLVARA